MVDTSWAERRGRMLKCKTHGLHYDPEMTTGCTLCLRNAAKVRPRRPPQLVLILLCILGMAAILFYLFGPGQDEATDIVDLGVASIPDAMVQKIDPDPYRAPVEVLETALFRTSLDETEDLLIVSGDIQAAAGNLSGDILRAEPVHGLTAADLIARMGQAIPTDQVVISDIRRARDQWLRIREQRFLPADWFSRPSADGTVAAGTSVADYSEVAASLRTLIEDGAAEVEALSAQIALPGEDDPALRWRQFADDWQAELDSLESRLPARPDAAAAAGLLVAIQDLEQALGLARTLASSAEPPSVTDTRFDDAGDAALRAQQGFDDLVN